MKDFEEHQRELFRSHLKNNIAAFSLTSDASMTILSTRTLAGRLDAQQITQSLALVRQQAWSSISVNLHNQLSTLVRETAAHVGTQLAVMIPLDLRTEIDQPILGMTLPQWLASAETLERARVLKAMRSGFGVHATPLAAFTAAAPYALSNSSVSAITVTSASAVMNRVALEIYKLAGIKRYGLATSGDRRDPSAYQRDYSVDDPPQAPMFIGDRSYPVFA
jgi:hypothetical protein